MRALIRNKCETVTQDMGYTFINWNTGAPLTNPDWYRGPYTLVNDYVEDKAASARTQDPEAPVQVCGTVVIDGVTYIRTP